ncbi:MAG: hypothetical protein WC464_07745, partial [Bdellovibrionales bacterium]
MRFQKGYGMAQVRALLSVVYTDVLGEPVPYHGVKVFVDRSSSDDKPGPIAVSIRSPSLSKSYTSQEVVAEVEKWMPKETNPEVLFYAYRWNGDFCMDISCNSEDTLK